MNEWSVDGITYTQCIECGKVMRIAPNRTRCEKCQKRYVREYSKEYQRKRRKAYAKMGLCIWCGGKTENGATHCIKCLDKYNARRREQNERRRGSEATQSGISKMDNADTDGRPDVNGRLADD